MLNPSTQDPSQSLHGGVGIAIKSIDPAQRHIAFVYRNSAGDMRLSHLAWHKRFVDEPWDQSYYWAIAGDLDTIESPIVIARLESIRALQPEIPYAFLRDGCRFSTNAAGALIFEAGEAGTGLTCSTYILAVMNSIAMPVLAEATWTPREEDAAWFQKIIEALTANPRVSAEHLQAVEATLGIARFRPEEVAGSFASNPWPVQFDHALELAQEVLADLA